MKIPTCMRTRLLGRSFSPCRLPIYPRGISVYPVSGAAGGPRARSACGERDSAGLRAADHAPGLELEPREGARGNGGDLDADAQAAAQRLLDRLGRHAVGRVKQHADLVQLLPAEDLDLKLLDGWKLPHDLLDRGGEDVHPADDQHVVEPSQDAAGQAHE